MPPVYSKRLRSRIPYINRPLDQHRNSPCEHACPAGSTIQAVHFMLAEKNVDKALGFLLSRNPFPGITGRVCPRFCESACNRKEHDEAISIRSIERFIADRGRSPWPRKAESTGKKIAVIGAGPAGLTSACHAALLGHSVTVFEASNQAGGIPRNAIPEFRLPRQVVDVETARALQAGDIQLYVNTALGRDIFLPDLVNTYDAVILAVGLQKERKLPIPGGDKAIPAVAWLKKFSSSRDSLKDREVLIIGGGGVAMDCAFTACRLGAAKVALVCLEAADAMRVPPEEIEQAQKEDIVFYNNYSASSLISLSSGMLRLVADPVKSFRFEDDGSLTLERTAEKQVEFDADIVICASGLLAAPEALGAGMPEIGAGGNVIIDPESMATSIPGIFAAGDLATGPSSVAAAIGGGRAAAMQAHKFVMGLPLEMDIKTVIDAEDRIYIEKGDLMEPPHVVEYKEIFNSSWHERAGRPTLKIIPETFPKLPFREIAVALTEKDAVEEAARCMHCGQCAECGNCVDACPGHILEMREDGPYVAWPDECWHCGCCRINCPTGAISYEFPLSMLV